MGNSCSSGQAHKDRDNVSQHSEESPSYRAARPEDPAGPAEPPPDKKPPPKPRSVASVSDSVSLSSPVTSPPGREGAGSPAPAPAPAAPAAAALPEDLRRLLLGAAPLARPPRRRALAVYVCAADSQDCCGEKGALQCGAAVRLRARARRAGWRVHVADLHWRSPLEQQRDHRLSALCTAELARQSELGALVPVVFLNAGLGTPLLPLTLDAGDFAAALAAAAHDQDRALLNKWYQLDAGATPACYRLARGAVRGRREMARALDVLVRTLPQEAADAYLTTVVEQEIQHTVLMSAEAARRCVWVTRGEGAPPPEPELARRLLALQRDLKQHLSERNIIRVSSRGAGAVGAAGAGAVGAAGADAALGARLDAALDALLADDDAPRGWAGVPASLFEEIHEHLAFAQRAAQCTSNREITLNELKTYISGQSGVPLVLLGGAGCGKATLVARALPAAGRAAVVRFVGLTPASSSSHLLLKSIVDQLHVMVHGGVYRGRDSQAALSAALHRLLAASRRLLLCVVGADALRGARWLPSRLPAHVRCIVTVTEETDEPSSSAIMAVLSSDAGPRVLRAGAPGAAEAAAALAAAAAERPHRALPERVKAAAAACPLPLYAKILAWQNSVQEELFTDQAEAEPPPEPAICATLEDQLLQVLVTAEAALGAARAAAALALLAAARRGLADEEVLDLLAHDPLFQSEETYLPWAPAALFWASLCALLGAWLRWDARGAARWRDAALAAAARDRYLAAGELRARRALADYWEGVWFEENDPKMAGRLVSQENKFSEDCYNSRKLDELPYQHYHLSRDQPELFALRPYFTDLRWIHDKVAANPCTWFLEDVALIQLEPLPEHVEILKDFLETHSYALDYDHRQFYGLLKQSLDRRIRSGLEIKSDICKRWLEAARNPPIPTLVPVNSDFLDAGEPGSEEAPGTRTFDLVVRLEGRFVATVSTEREEICVWDVTTSRRLRTLAGVPAPAALVPVGRRRAVVLCRRELRLYDLDKGQFLVALKGVMNQKMPYYGLHDARHLVALSRNRMYVNLMNIETGDCVTTFKAGEDRFLNSLLVSGDGRILVCGDETQKPFPLLVWSLTSRKLLYDLRIPHHDFDTSKAAITHEGSYVCVVSRELDEPSPNFIVVYDLQSGTLFKKWKPRADAHALAISSADGCVVSGHADARILVWDLVTGNCRLSLRGHVSAPTTLRLAAGGGALLSAAAPRLDRSVRLWDLRAGNLIAVYTPPERITCCEVLCGGSLIALAMENYKDLVTLRLDGPLPEVVTSEGADPEPYGTPENDGKVFDLTEADC